MSTAANHWIRQPEDVREHLRYAAERIRHAIVTAQGIEILGTLAPPAEDGTVPFQVDGRLAELVTPPRVGASLRVDYEGERDRFTFYTEMIGQDMLRRWILAAPLTVERTDRRVATRYDVEDDDDFSLVVQHGDTQATVGLIDLSSAGCAFRFDPARLPLEQGARLDGLLGIPGLPPYRLVLEVSNIRPAFGAPHLRIAGCRFVGLASADRMNIAGALSAWRYQNR